MSRVLRSGAVAEAPRRFTGGPRFLDAELQRIVDSATDRGFQDGLASGRQEVAQVAARLGSSIQHAIHEARRAREADISAAIDLAIEMATVILGASPVGDSEALAQRVIAALAEIDDGTVVIAAHPDDVEMLTDAVRGDVEIRTDTTLVPGEARILGDWAHVDLTHEAVLEVLKDGLL